ncbi:MAG: hypothetical protein K1X42_14170 [Opitutaceae bacterium]|nr:hypothetical protein [Opitutaceae bacterium]
MTQDAFTDTLTAIGNGLYFVVSAAFCGVSFLTTYQGFQTIFGHWPSVAASVGVQAAMLGAWIFFGHNRAPHRRIPWLCVGLFTCCLSITFSFVGLRFDYAKNVLQRERPIRDQAEFQAQRGKMQRAASAERGVALAQIDKLIAESEGRRNVAQLKQDARKIRAAQYRESIAALNRQRREIPSNLTPAQWNAEDNRIHKEIRRYQSLLAIVEGTRETLGLDIQTEGVAQEPLRKLRQDIVNYAPAFLDVPDWNGLRREYDRFINLVNETPGDADFKAGFGTAMPEPPAAKVISANGDVFDGEGHPINEAFRHLARLESADLFVFALAVAFDIVPLLFTWALRAKMRTVPEAISAMATWMRRTRLALETMEGVIPFAWIFWWNMLFSRPMRTGHESVIAFEEFISREQLRMDQTLRVLVLPDALRELISLETSYLHTRAITIASERADQFERLATQAYERCLAAVRNAAGIDEATRAELTQFLHRQLQRFNATVSDYATEGEILDEIARDHGKENEETRHVANDPQHSPGGQQDHSSLETEEPVAAQA